MYFLNGKYYETDPMGNDFFYGYSLFETIMGLKNIPVFLDEHLERLEKSSKLLGIKNVIKKDVIFEIIKKEKLKENDEFLVKIQVSDKNNYLKIERTNLREAESGIQVKIIDNYYQNEMGFVKSGNYLLNILVRKELLSENYFEGVFCNRNEVITEGTISNIFFVKNNVLKTPSLDLNILPGITRNKIIKIAKKMELEVQEGHFSVNDLLESEGIFFTNSLMKKGLIWVNEINGTAKNKNSLFHNLEKEYLKLIKNMI